MTVAWWTISSRYVLYGIGFVDHCIPFLFDCLLCLPVLRIMPQLRLQLRLLRLYRLRRRLTSQTTKPTHQLLLLRCSLFFVLSLDDFRFFVFPRSVFRPSKNEFVVTLSFFKVLIVIVLQCCLFCKTGRSTDLQIWQLFVKMDVQCSEISHITFCCTDAFYCGSVWESLLCSSHTTTHSSLAHTSLTIFTSFNKPTPSKQNIPTPTPSHLTGDISRVTSRRRWNISLGSLAIFCLQDVRTSPF